MLWFHLPCYPFYFVTLRVHYYQVYLTKNSSIKLSSLIHSIKILILDTNYLSLNHYL